MNQASYKNSSNITKDKNMFKKNLKSQCSEMTDVITLCDHYYG